MQNSQTYGQFFEPLYVDDGVTNEAWDNLDNEPAYNTYKF